MRVGVLMAGVPGIPWAVLALFVGVVELFVGFVGEDTGHAVRALRYSGLLLGGSLVAGVLMGLVIGGGLALASRVITSSWGLALVGALLGALVFPAEIVAVALGTDAAPAQIGVTLLAWPVMAVVAAVHSPDIAGRTHGWAWLWSPWPGRRLRRR
ncbi:hypothetical protein [Streptomyces capitiformicae]|uniref:hypothetical protein n=1 Tax=Streptomyces capitiformicae TaxID=2014920 RepID=UPI0016761B99|nr:hypothetical protein [Streptomyces capitiformicae]